MRFILMITYCLLAGISEVGAHSVGLEPRRIVLTFDMRGGQKPRIADGPVLTIYKDGTVVTRALKPGDPPVIKHFSAEEQAAFFREFFDKTGVLNMTTSSIENEIMNKSPQLRPFPSAPVTCLSLHLMNESTSICIKGVSAKAYLVPEAASLQQFYLMQRRLLSFVKQINMEAN
jgi:hypothetical protein